MRRSCTADDHPPADNARAIARSLTESRPKPQKLCNLQPIGVVLAVMMPWNFHSAGFRFAAQGLMDRLTVR